MYTDLATTLLPLAVTLRLVSDILLIDFGSRPISSFRKVQVNKLNLRENSEHHIVKHGNDGLYCSQSLTIVPMNTIAAKKPKHPANDAVEAWGNTAPTMVAQNQFEKVDKELAFPRSRMGNISAHTTQTTGPHEYANPIT